MNCRTDVRSIAGYVRLITGPLWDQLPELCAIDYRTTVQSITRLMCDQLCAIDYWTYVRSITGVVCDR